MKKKTLFLSVLLALALGLTGCGGSGKESDSESNQEPTNKETTTEKESSQSEGESEASGDPLIMTCEAGFAPYEYIGQGGEVEGIDVDIANEIAKDLNRPLEIKNMDFDGAILEASNGKSDFVASGVSVTPERQESLDFSDNYVDSKEVVLVNSNNPRVDQATNEGLKDKLIGVQQGNIADLYVSDAENVEAKEVKRYDKFAQAAEDLKNDKIDCIVMDEAPAKELEAANQGEIKILEGDPLFSDQYAIGVKKGNTELLDSINKTIKRLKDSGELDKIIEKHTSK